MKVCYALLHGGSKRWLWVAVLCAYPLSTGIPSVAPRPRNNSTRALVMKGHDTPSHVGSGFQCSKHVL